MQEIQSGKTGFIYYSLITKVKYDKRCGFIYCSMTTRAVCDNGFGLARVDTSVFIVWILNIFC